VLASYEPINWALPVVTKDIVVRMFSDVSFNALNDATIDVSTPKYCAPFRVKVLSIITESCIATPFIADLNSLNLAAVSVLLILKSGALNSTSERTLLSKFYLPLTF
jgi:hypothetical protein